MANMTFGVNIIPKANTSVTLGNSDNPWEIVSPNLTGTPTAPTATSGTNTTQIATTAFVQGELAGYATIADTVLTTTLSRGRATNTTVGTGSFAFGDDVTASGYQSHAEGMLTVASGSEAHAEGVWSIASGDHSHAENGYTIACADYSHAQGENTISNYLGMHTFGRYNYPSFPSVTPDEWVSDTDYIIGNYVQYDGSFFFCTENHTSSLENMPTVNTDIWLEIGAPSRLSLVEAVGWGAGHGSRKNIRTLDIHGSETLYGTLYVNCDEKGLGGTEVATKTNATQSVAGLMSAADKTKLDGAVTGPSSSVNNRVAVFDGTTGKKVKDSGFTIGKSVPSDAVFTDTTYPTAVTYISRTGTTFTATRANGTTFTFTQQDNNTNTWRGYQLKEYEYKYTVAASGVVNITGTNFGVSNPSGYAPVAAAYASTGAGGGQCVIHILHPTVTGGSTILGIKNLTSSSQTFTAHLAILYLQTS